LQVIVRINKGTVGYVSNITLSKLTFGPANLLASAAALVSYDGVITGSVTVQTQAKVTPFVVQYVYPDPYFFNSAQTCPVTYRVPNTAGGQTVAADLLTVALDNTFLPACGRFVSFIA
jgi:hypothetical protein